MSKIYNLYENNIDKAWYNSSNIIYSECYDNENELKKVKIIFKNGRSYLYEDVKVNDYLLFRESASQGKALNKYIKQYKVQRIDDTDLELINNQLKEILENNIKNNSL